MKNLVSFLIISTMLACGSDSASTAGTGGSGGVGGMGGDGGSGGQGFSSDPPLVLDADERPADVDIPTDYDPSVSYPLVVLLHGAGTDGRTQAGYLQLFNFVDEKQFIMAYPNGTPNEEGRRLWNGAVCCTGDDAIDDVGYISGLIEEAKETYNIDATRVYLIGHSNGGFMSFRMACEAPTLFTALVSLAGGTYEDPADCEPGTPPVSALIVHGTADLTIPYEGSPGAYIAGVEATERSAESAGCDPETSTFLESLDLLPAVDGDETDLYAYSTGCDEGLDAELWIMNDGGHQPFFQALDSGKPLFPELIIDWLYRHSR